MLYYYYRICCDNTKPLDSMVTEHLSILPRDAAAVLRYAAYALLCLCVCSSVRPSSYTVTFVDPIRLSVRLNILSLCSPACDDLLAPQTIKTITRQSDILCRLCGRFGCMYVGVTVCHWTVVGLYQR